MRKIIVPIIAFLIISITMKSQTAKFENIVDFKLINSGSISDNNNDVDGYYFFYKVDKLKKGDREYAIKILDNNLNVVATKKIIDSKRTFLATSAYNNKEMLFLFINTKEKQFRLVGYDLKGNKSRDTKYAIDKGEFNWIMSLQASAGYRELLTPIDDKGFILTTNVKNKKVGYRIKFLSSIGEIKPWIINSPVDANSVLTLNPIKATDKYIIALEMSRKSKMSQKIDIAILAIDSNTGETLFKKPYTKESNPRLVTNSFVTNDEIIILGEYFMKGENVFKAKSKGLFVEKFDSTGKLLEENKVSWENQLFTKLKSVNGKTKKRSYAFFHDIVITENGDYYAVGELYKKTASAAGIAGMALMMASGGRSSSTIPLTQLTITDAVFYKFDKDFKLIDINVFKKGKSTAPSVNDFGSPQLNAHALEIYGAFDFVNVQTDPINGRFYANFIDYERIKDAKNQLAFVSVIHENGELSTDKIYLPNNRGHFTRALPAKIGNVLIIDYFKKEKRINLHIEKLNIK